MTDKTRADVKGGTLIQYGGRLRLLEVAQVTSLFTVFFKQEIYLRKPPIFFCKVPKDHMEEFMDVKKFNVFNTNNLWISMPAIQRVVREKALDMEIIVNPVIKHYCNIHGYDHETLEGDFTFGLNTRDFIIKLNTVLT